MKRVIMLLVTVVMLTSLVSGCANNNGSPTSATGTNTANEANTATEQNNADTTGDGAGSADANSNLEPITITMFSADLNIAYDNFESVVSKEIQARTGVTLLVESAVGGDPAQKLSLMLAGGDYPDLIFPEASASLYVDAGALIPLDDLIEEHGPNLKALYGDLLPRMRWSTEDPTIYRIGSRAVNREIVSPSPRTWVQHAVVKELGYPKMTTLQDLEDAVAAYAQMYPEINGQPTIPIIAPAEGTRILNGITALSAEATGLPNRSEWYVNPETYEVQFHNRRPIEREYYRWLNGVFNKGLLDPEVFIHKDDIYKEKIASGRVLSVIDAGWGFGSALQSLTDAGMEDRRYGPYPIVLEDGIESRVTQVGLWGGGSGIYITRNCKDPVRAVQFLDWMATEEAQVLLRWGIEGVHYEYDADGKRTFLPDVKREKDNNPKFAQMTGVGLYVFPFPDWGDKKDSTGNYVNPESGYDNLIANFTDIEKEVLAGYNATTWMDLFPKDIYDQVGADVPSILDEDILAKYNRVRDDIGMRRIPEAIMTPSANFDTVWDAYLDEVQAAGADDVEAEVTRLLNDRLIEWEIIK